MENSTCIKCLEIKPIDQFHQNLTSKNNHSPLCKLCTKEYNRIYNARKRRIMKAFKNVEDMNLDLVLTAVQVAIHSINQN